MASDGASFKMELLSRVRRSHKRSCAACLYRMPCEVWSQLIRKVDEMARVVDGDGA